MKRCRLMRTMLGLVLLAVNGALFAGCSFHAKPKVYRVGILCGLDFFANTADGFKAKMAELGYIEGENIVYNFQKTSFDPAVEQRILGTFVADKVDLILTFPTEASIAAKKAVQGTKIPVVFANANIEGVDLVDNVRAPGGNVTGVRYPGPDLALKRFEIMMELAPKIKRIWIPYLRGYPIVASQMEVLRPAAAALGITLTEAPAANADELKAILSAKEASGDIGMDAILMIAEPLEVTPAAFEVMGRFAAAHKLPIGGAFVSAGGYESIFGLSTDNQAVGRQAAPIADKILRGSSPGAIPVVSAECFMTINPRAARRVGITVPAVIMNQANEIIR